MLRNVILIKVLDFHEHLPPNLKRHVLAKYCKEISLIAVHSCGRKVCFSSSQHPGISAKKVRHCPVLEPESFIFAKGSISFQMKVEHNYAAMPICDDHESNVARMNGKNCVG